MKVIKRDGSKEDFDVDKIILAVNKAFNSCNKKTPQYLKELFFALFSTLEGDVISIEEIQNKVEDTLMNNKFFDVAKSYIIYREKHKQARFIKERIDYMNKYSQSSDNAATSSETDANANVTIKNVANLEGEVYKTTNRIIQRQRMKDKLKQLFPEVANQYINDLNNHIIYTHDEASTPVLKNYTYSPKEVVEIKYNDLHCLLSLESLYKLIDTIEIERNFNEGVWSKVPSNLFIRDKDNWTKVNLVTKKIRHRDLYRVKTSFGEDIIVTDNHPLIIDEDKTKTINAIDSLGYKQLRLNNKISFKGIKEIDLAQYIECDKVYSNFIVTHETQAPYYFTKRYLKLDRDLGYVVGFFIGDGNYDNTYKVIQFSQKENEILDKLAESLFESFGVVSYRTLNSNGIWCMKVCSTIVESFFRNYLKIKDKAQNKCLPFNILNFNEDFAKGIIEGIIDSDGTISNNGASVQIRLSSRECIMQLTKLLTYFGYGVANTTQSTSFGNNLSIKTNYDIFGVVFTNCPEGVKFDKSYKWNTKINREINKCLKYSTGWSNISNIEKIKEGSFLDSCYYIYDITTESNTFDCNNIWVHNCEAVSLYPLMLEGVGNLDGITPSAPKNLDSFCGQFVNAAFLLASQCKGAVAFGSFFVAFNYYCVKEWGSDYYDKVDYIITSEHYNKKKTIKDAIIQAFQQCVWGINQPAGNRGYQSPFINFSYYDSNYFKALFNDFYYPDSTKPEWKAIDYLQRTFMNYLNEERLNAVIAMPVETMALLSDGNDIIDKEYKDFTAEMYAKGHSFFTYISDNPNGLASCCRLRSEIQDNIFSFTNGLTGIQTGSCNVITLNLNRIVQDCDKSYGLKRNGGWKENTSFLKDYLIDILERVYKYHIAYKTMLYDIEDTGMLTPSKAGYIYMKKLYSTIGLNGINEAAEFLGIECSYNEDYKNFCRLITGTIKEQNKLHNIYDNKRPFLFNQEFVPAENLGVRNYNWDKEDGYYVNPDRVLYNSYFYLAHDNTSVLDKFRLHGKEFTDTLDGGVGCHINLEEHLSKEQYIKLIEFAVENGTSYFTFNIPNSQCDDCHYIVKVPINKCPKCGSTNIKWYTRIIGYLRAIKNFSYERQIEASKRVYSNGKNQIK